MISIICIGYEEMMIDFVRSMVNIMFWREAAYD